MKALRAMQWLTRLFLAVTALLALAAGALWIAQRPKFEIRRIEVRAANGELQHVTVASLRAALRGSTNLSQGPSPGPLRGNYFTLRLDDARRAFEVVPWVAAVSVRRAWPDRLIVTFTEHRALATWGDGRLLSDAGVLFVANPAEAEIDGALPEFDGPERFAPEASRLYGEFNAALAALNLTVESVEVSERASWTVRADSGQTFELGRDDPAGRVNERLAAIAAAYAVVLARVNGAPPRIDARYPNGFAVAMPAVNRKP